MDVPPLKAETVFVTKPDGTLMSLRLPALRSPCDSRPRGPFDGHPRCDNREHRGYLGDTAPGVKPGRCARCDELALLDWYANVARWYGRKPRLTPAERSVRRRAYVKAYHQRPAVKDRERARHRKEAAADIT